MREKPRPIREDHWKSRALSMNSDSHFVIFGINTVSRRFPARGEHHESSLRGRNHDTSRFGQGFQARHASAGVIDGEMWVPHEASRVNAELRAEEVPNAHAILRAKKKLGPNLGRSHPWNTLLLALYLTLGITPLPRQHPRDSRREVIDDY